MMAWVCHYIIYPLSYDSSIYEWPGSCVKASPRHKKHGLWTQRNQATTTRESPDQSICQFCLHCAGVEWFLVSEMQRESSDLV